MSGLESHRPTPDQVNDFSKVVESLVAQRPQRIEALGTLHASYQKDGQAIELAAPDKKGDSRLTAFRNFFSAEITHPSTTEGDYTLQEKESLGARVPNLLSYKKETTIFDKNNNRVPDRTHNLIQSHNEGNKEEVDTLLAIDDAEYAYGDYVFTQERYDRFMDTLIALKNTGDSSTNGDIGRGE